MLGYERPSRYPVFQTCIDVDTPDIVNAASPGHAPVRLPGPMHFDQVWSSFPRENAARAFRLDVP